MLIDHTKYTNCPICNYYMGATDGGVECKRAQNELINQPHFFFVSDYNPDTLNWLSIVHGNVKLYVISNGYWNLRDFAGNLIAMDGNADELFDLQNKDINEILKTIDMLALYS